MRTLALIPARAGSKGVPHKNTRLFRGKPLLAWAIEAGMATCDRTYVSTEDLEIAQIAAAYGASVIMRPAELATDEAAMLPVVQHALEHMKDRPDVVVLLQPSSPALRRAEHVRDAIDMIRDWDCDSVASAVPIPAPYSPGGALKMSGDDLVPYAYPHPTTIDKLPTRRQDHEAAFYRDGTAYAVLGGVIENGSLYGISCRALIISAADSITIDTEEDWIAAEAKHG